MNKVTVNQLAAQVNVLASRVVALEEELARTKQARRWGKQSDVHGVSRAACIKWLNEHKPAGSYTQSDIEYAAKQLGH